HRVDRDDLHVHIQVTHHAPDDDELLRVLAPEVRARRFQNVEELEHHRRDALEVPGAELALQTFRDRAHIDDRFGALPVHLFNGRLENVIHTFGLQKGQVPFDVSRVSGEILTRTELGRVDEDAHEDVV